MKPIYSTGVIDDCHLRLSKYFYNTGHWCLIWYDTRIAKSTGNFDMVILVFTLLLLSVDMIAGDFGKRTLTLCSHPVKTLYWRFFLLHIKSKSKYFWHLFVNQECIIGILIPSPIWYNHQKSITYFWDCNTMI